MKSSPSNWHKSKCHVHNVKSTVKISSIFVSRCVFDCDRYLSEMSKNRENVDVQALLLWYNFFDVLVKLLFQREDLSNQNLTENLTNRQARGSDERFSVKWTVGPS